MRRLRVAVTLLSCLAFSGPVAAQSKDSTVAMVVEAAKTHKEFEGLIIGAGRGVEGANLVLQVRGKPPIYCQPAKLGMVGSQFVGIFTDYVRKNKTAAGRDITEIGIVMAMALSEVFPCG